jgi:glycosyltransferase involved in cell wall biosynthesis
MASTLLVIIPDQLTAILNKGEVTNRYYNPGDLFDEVHILMVNADRPDPALVQPMVGRARLFLHNLPIPPGRFFHKTLGWRPRLMRPWAEQAVALTRSIRPNLQRCYGNSYNAFLGAEIRRTLGIPLVISLHTQTDDNRRDWTKGWKERVFAQARRSFEAYALRNADIVTPVYQSILRYTNRLGIDRVEVVYNAVGNDAIQGKTQYEIKGRPRILTVGNQIPGKNPGYIIEAVKELEVDLHVVGSGPLNSELRSLTERLHLKHKIFFHPSMENKTLCRELPNYDLFAAHCDYDGIPKAVMEPLLAGLPTVVNRLPTHHQVPEYSNEFIELVDGTPESYAQALSALLADTDKRRRLGQAARAHALRNWNPADQEARMCAIYKALMHNTVADLPT